MVAAETGWPLDKVTRYAQPPLGERAYVAEQARAVEISRSRGGSTLEESVALRLSVDPQVVDWDSHRSADGRWLVTASHRGAVVGTWAYEAVGRSVQPLDESARALMGGGPSLVTDTAAAQTTAPATAPTTASMPPSEPEPTVEVAQPESARPRLVSVTSDPTASAVAHETDSVQGELVDDADVTSAPRRAKRVKTKKGRASVPSWDEILFGASKPED